MGRKFLSNEFNMKRFERYHKGRNDLIPLPVPKEQVALPPKTKVSPENLIKN